MSTHAGTGANRLGLRATESQTAKMTGGGPAPHAPLQGGKIFLFFSGIVKGLGLTMPIIYNRIKEIDMTFFVLLLMACFVGFLGAEVLQ